MSCIVNLLDFYLTINCEELYIKYVKKLASLHEQCSNWAEAASTLLLYSDSLQWSERPLKFIWKKHTYCKTHRALKEQLCKDAAENFERGQMWEKALKIMKELAAQYEDETYEYPKLAELHQQMAVYYKNIMTELRPEPEYFRVAFYGRGFPAFLQNKVFVYRGKGFERLPEFQSRILDQVRLRLQFLLLGRFSRPFCCFSSPTQSPCALSALRLLKRKRDPCNSSRSTRWTQ